LPQSFGNLRDFDYDFEKIWKSQKAKKVREWILKTRCACTHECFLTTNILFSPKIYPQLLGQLVQLI